MRQSPMLIIHDVIELLCGLSLGKCHWREKNRVACLQKRGRVVTFVAELTITELFIYGRKT